MLNYKSPSLLRKSDILDYRREILLYDKNFDGCAGLGNFQTIEQWLKRIAMMSPNSTVRGFYPTAVYLAYRENQLVGMLNIRLSEDDFLRRYAGHIGYNVRPSARNQGIASEMLRFALAVCRKNGIEQPIICTEADNLYSQKTALSCGFLHDGEEITETNQKIIRFRCTIQK